MSRRINSGNIACATAKRSLAVFPLVCWVSLSLTQPSGLGLREHRFCHCEARSAVAIPHMDRTGSVYEEDSCRRLPRRPAVAGLLATTKTFEPAIALAEPASNTGATHPGAWEQELLNLVLLIIPG